MNQSGGGDACPVTDSCVIVTLCSSAPTPDSRPDTSVVSAKEDSLLSASGPNGQAGAYQSGNYRWVWQVHASVGGRGEVHSQGVRGGSHCRIYCWSTALQHVGCRADWHCHPHAAGQRKTSCRRSGTCRARCHSLRTGAASALRHPTSQTRVTVLRVCLLHCLDHIPLWFLQPVAASMGQASSPQASPVSATSASRYFPPLL